MAGRLAIDFGTSNTRAAAWNPATGQAELLTIPDVSVTRKYHTADGEDYEVSCVPSLVNYDGDKVWIGRQVLDRQKHTSPATFRWMKHYIAARLELPRRVEGRDLTFYDAGRDFLTRVLDYAITASGTNADDEVAITLPVESFEHFQNWLGSTCELAGIRRFRLLDEASAAALGYDVGARANDVFLVLDFGAGTLDVSIVRIEARAEGGRHCRVLGKAGAELGGMTIDKWLYEDVLHRCGKQAEDVRQLSGLLLAEVERAKETLSVAPRAEVSVNGPDGAVALQVGYVRPEFEALLRKRGLFEGLEQTTRRALARAAEHGYGPEHIKAALLVGGSSLIPCVRDAVCGMFGDRVRYHRPLDAVALGGAAFVGGAEIIPQIQHDYAIMRYDRDKKDYRFEPIIRAGTPYPMPKTPEPYAVVASHSGQAFLGLRVYEIGYGGRGCSDPGLELVFGSDGCGRFVKCREPEEKSRFWMNQTSPTFIRAEPPAQKGDAFEVWFSVDDNRFLCVTVRDGRSGRIVMDNKQVVRLT